MQLDNAKRRQKTKTDLSPIGAEDISSNQRNFTEDPILAVFHA